MSAPFTVTRGDGPIVLGMPHVGTAVPQDIRDRLNDEGHILRDTDWYVDRLYAGLIPGLTVVRANFHRYVIDANRDPSGQSLYPGASTTDLVPLTTFDGTPIWREGAEPGADDIAARLAAYHAASRPGTGSRSCGIAIRSARSSPGSSTARCRISTSAPMAARPATPGSRPRRLRRPARRGAPTC